MKTVVLKTNMDILGLIEKIEDSAERARNSISRKSKSASAIELLQSLKFDKIGFDPLDCNRELNFIEQLNQTFTYLASLKAAQIIFNNHSVSNLTLNLGTASGSDLETNEDGGIAAEVFAATSPNSNRKLQKDIEKVLRTNAKHKYSFFMCPGIATGLYAKNQVEGVTVWSLGV